MSVADIDPAIRAHILARLAEVERAQGVRILFAAESGSRAWGFPSPDSDWDVRFVYAHPVDWYLTLNEARDVIEGPLDRYAVDLAGWDIRKTLRLLLKSNAVLYEWCCSPIVYRDDGEARSAVKALFERVAGPAALAYHYRETARTSWKRMMEGRDAVRLKRYFYVVRPLLAVEWVNARGTPPPMQIDALLSAQPLPPDVDKAFRELMALTRMTPEVGHGPRLAALDAWIVPRLDAVPAPPAGANHLGSTARAEADALFCRLIGS